MTVKVAVYMILVNEDGKLLFERRCNTGWQDGKLYLPSGHVEMNEFPYQTAIRELKEEVNLCTSPENVLLKSVVYRKDSYIEFYYLIKRWEGCLKNCEPNICTELMWIDIKNLQEDIEPVLLDVLNSVDESDVCKVLFV